ncbi:elongation of very long chain fatty acids protein 6-like [Oppia nitens]|uniref:elongation of very long chain fatty acids protein 6-like n=1 Tax=Oppia nitens TaxID=1686743 RepID=UPI0023DA45E8|nr:elongation of very long chain fatty acids protein 6-like [Oppia nitens]
MLFNDTRYNNHHIIAKIGSKQWSTNWHQFSGFPFAFKFEDNFRRTHEYKQEWLRDHWHYSIYISIVYVTIVHVLQTWMNTRDKPFNLRLPLALWSTCLALFSICGTIKCLPEFIAILLTKGIYASFCESCYYEDIRLVFWYWLFVISKVVELGDTLFIILRRQRLIKLHWIHHCLTLCYSWYVYADIPATARWMVNMNFLVHSLMYTYYAMKAVRLAVPPLVAKFITSLQILQMMFGLYINLRAFQFKLNGLPCDLSVSVVTTGLVLYYVFFLLFVNFFIRTYLLVKKQQKQKQLSYKCGSSVTSAETSGHNHPNHKRRSVVVPTAPINCCYSSSSSSNGKLLSSTLSPSSAPSSASTSLLSSSSSPSL